MTEWYGDEAFWQTFFPLLFPDQRFEIAEEQVNQVLALVHFQGTSILDLACGPGRHSVVLAAKGFQVTGVDLSPFLLARARHRAQAAGVAVEWIQSDMRQFRRPAGFDLCLSLFTSFGYFADPEEDILVLRNVYDSLTNAGACLIDVAGKEWLAQRFSLTTSEELPGGALAIQRHQILDDWTRIRNHWILVKDGRTAEYRFEHNIYSAQELKDRMRGVGFRSVEIYGDLDGSAYDLDARRLIAIGRK